jgi:Uma2 family endonuclease
MNAFAKIDVDTFLKFAAEHPEQRFELERGRIMQQMTGGTKQHNLIGRRICRLLEDQIDDAKWTVVHERGVKIGTSARYPDVVVEPFDEPGDSLATARPVLIVEVLSPTTSAIDLNAKPAEYLAIASLDAFVVAHQDMPAVLIWQRDPDGTFPAEPVELEGMDKTLEINGRCVSAKLAFGEIYRGIV